MKNLSIQEKNDLDSCVFKSLGQSEKTSFFALFKKIFLKIKSFFTSKK